MRERDGSDHELTSQIWGGEGQFGVPSGAGDGHCPSCGELQCEREPAAFSASVFTLTPHFGPCGFLQVGERREIERGRRLRAKEKESKKRKSSFVAIPHNDSKTLQVSFIEFGFFFPAELGDPE